MQQSRADPVRPALLGPAGQRRRARAGRRPARQRRGQRALPARHRHRGRGPRGPAGRRTCSTTLVRRTVRSGWRLLLLVDEAEELLTVARTDAVGAAPAAARSSRRAPRCARCSPPPSAWPASTSSTDFATSPFLQGFIPPALPDAAARPTRRARCSRAARFSAEEIETILERTACHPSWSSSSPAACSRAATSRPPWTRSRPTRWCPTSSPWTSRPWTATSATLLEEVAREGSGTRSELAQAARPHRGGRWSRCSSACDDGLPGARRTRATASATGSSSAGSAARHGHSLASARVNRAARSTVESIHRGASGP